jgi:DNA repair protein RadA/Sms
MQELRHRVRRSTQKLKHRRPIGSPRAISEFDRVLGGGIVPGSLMLLGGEPGIGKSTLLLQAAANFAHSVGPVLYASGEESEHQIKARGDRLGVGDAPLLSAVGNLHRAHPRGGRPRQADDDHRRLGADGVLAQVSIGAGQHRPGARGGDAVPLHREGPQHSRQFLVGHVTKDGNIAGPKALEHVVDTGAVLSKASVITRIAWFAR